MLQRDRRHLGHQLITDIELFAGTQPLTGLAHELGQPFACRGAHQCPHLPHRSHHLGAYFTGLGTPTDTPTYAGIGRMRQRSYFPGISGEST